jgi:competence protein ComGC
MRYGSKWINGRKFYGEWPSDGKGLTLIEVLVLVAIIGCLAGIVLPVLHRARQSAREEAAQKDQDGAVPVMPVQAEKSPVFPSGQEVVTVGRDDLEGYVAKTKKRIVSVTPLWKDSIGGGYRPTHYLIVMEGK